jgi:hypothetical protein
MSGMVSGRWRRTRLLLVHVRAHLPGCNCKRQRKKSVGTIINRALSTTDQFFSW